MKTDLVLAGMVLLFVACGSQPAAPAAKNEVPPKPLSLVQPAYPEEARKAGVEGMAIIEVKVGVDGAVLDCQLAEGSGNSSLDSAALGAARAAKFSAGTVDGKPVEMRVRLPFSFKLDGGAKEQHGGATRSPTWVRRELPPPEV